jgi:hypothetical protein
VAVITPHRSAKAPTVINRVTGVRIQVQGDPGRQPRAFGIVAITPLPVA